MTDAERRADGIVVGARPVVDPDQPPAARGAVRDPRRHPERPTWSDEVEVVRTVDIVALTRRPTPAPTWRRPARSAAFRFVKVESKGKGFRRLRMRLTD